jgi:hypothetical protein
MTQQPSSHGEERAPRGSRDNPVAMGETVRIGQWQVRVVAFDGDVWEQLQERNRRAQPPAEGFKDVMVSLAATYVGDSSSDPAWDFNWAVVGSGGNTFADMGEGRMNVAGPKHFRKQGETFPGGSIAGNVYFSVAAEQVNGATVWVRARKADRVFFALT